MGPTSTACQWEGGEGWSYPCVIERLRELASCPPTKCLRTGQENGICNGRVFVSDDDLGMLRGLADALEEAIR
jgi:hypothetical protein